MHVMMNLKSSSPDLFGAIVWYERRLSLSKDCSNQMSEIERCLEEERKKGQYDGR
jgi:hypothetical protein